MDAPGFACGNKERHPRVKEVYLETVGLQMPVGVRLGFLYDINLLFAQFGNLPETTDSTVANSLDSPNPDTMVPGLAKLPTQGEHPAQNPSGTHVHRPKQVTRFERNYGA